MLRITVFLLLLALCGPLHGQQTQGRQTQGQQGQDQNQAQPSRTSSLPDEPRAQTPDKPVSRKQTEDARISASGELPAILAPQMTRERLSLGDKFHLYTHQASTPVVLLPPALLATFSMAHPKANYPRDWKNGAAAYGRNYGDALMWRQAQQLGSFLAGAAAHEDPRYQPFDGHSAFGRVGHALAFVLIDRSDSGRAMPAFSNLAGAASSGLVGMAYLPRGYDDFTHAGQRGMITLGSFAASNLVNEFCPQWGPWMNKLHLPFVHPPCADRMPGRIP